MNKARRSPQKGLYRVKSKDTLPFLNTEKFNVSFGWLKKEMVLVLFGNSTDTVEENDLFYI